MDLTVAKTLWWGDSPDASIAGRITETSAALWTWAVGDHETVGPASHDIHALSFAIDPLQTEFSLDGRTIFKGIFRPGMLAVIPAGMQPWAVQRGGARKLHIYIPDSVMADAAGLPGTPVQIALPRSGLFQSQIIDSLRSSLIRVLRDAAPGSRLLLDAIGLELAVTLVRLSGRAHLSPVAAGLTRKQLERVEEYMQANIARDISLRELSSLVFSSPAQFCRAFNAAMGRPPHKYLIDLRLKRAQELLASTMLSVSDVAAAVGYDDPSYFSRLFRKRIGMQPRSFRKVSNL